MLGRREDEFRAEALRDLIGVVRAIHGAAIARGAGPLELRRIVAVLEELEETHGMGVSYRPGSVGWRAAHLRAEDGARRVADLVTLLDAAEPIVTAARARIARGVRR